MIEAKKISEITHDYSALEAVDPVYQEVARFSLFRRATRAMDEYHVHSHLLYRGAESKMQMGGAFPGNFASAPCVPDASLSLSGKSLVPDSV